jgi:hypothetical protein
MKIQSYFQVSQHELRSPPSMKKQDYFQVNTEQHIRFFGLSMLTFQKMESV